MLSGNEQEITCGNWIKKRGKNEWGREPKTRKKPLYYNRICRLKHHQR